MSKPIINLSYSTETHEFNLLVTNAEEVQYVLIYSAENRHVPVDEDGKPIEGDTTKEGEEKESEQKPTELSDLPMGEHYLPPDGVPSVIEHALTSAGTGNDRFVFTETQLAGSASSGHEVLHNVKGGTLKAVIITPEGKQYRISNKFTITESGEVKITGTETVSKALSGQFNKATKETTTKEKTKVKKETSPPETTNDTYTMEREQVMGATTTNDAWMLPAGIAAGIFVILVIAIVATIVKKRKANKQVKPSVYAHSELTPGIGGAPIPSATNTPGVQTPPGAKTGNSLYDKINGKHTSNEQQTAMDTSSEPVIKRLSTNGNSVIPKVGK